MLQSIQKKFSRVFVALYLFSCLFLSGCALEVPKQKVNEVPPKTLTIKMLDIGQGDAILIRSAQQTVLIDTGDVDEREQLVRLLENEGVTTIDKLIITHPHADHLGGAMGVLMNFAVKNVYDNGQVTTTSTYKKYIKKVTEKKVPYEQLLAGQVLDFGDGVRFEVLNPTLKETQAENDLNSNSVVGRLVYKDFSMLFTGDCESDREKELIKKYAQQLQSTVLKSPHHGSKTSSGNAYLKLVKPEAVLISAGNNNDYGHPHEPVLKRYKAMRLKVYRTDLDGSLTIHSDGNTYSIEKEKNK